MTAPTRTVHRPPASVSAGVGESAGRPDAIPKLTGNFAYPSDLWAEGMLWGATVRSPFARATIGRIDVAPALAVPGVVAALTQEDVPGRKTFGLEHTDQPVLADTEARFFGEPVALVVGRDEETARRGASAVAVEFEELEPLTDPEEADSRDEVFRRLRIRRGDPDLRGEVVVEGYYEVGIQDQAPLGPESGLAVPDGDGGVDLHATSQWVHVDHAQIVASLGLRPEQVRVHPAGMGGAFGAREDINLHIHLCLLALRTGKPVKMTYRRAESFAGHVHRHPARHVVSPRGRPVGQAHQGGGPDPARRWGVCLVHHGGGGQRLLLRRRPLSVRHRVGRRGRAPAPTTRPAGRCAGSVRCNRASATSHRWTGLPRPWEWIRSNSAAVTQSAPGMCSPPQDR